MATSSNLEFRSRVLQLQVAENWHRILDALRNAGVEYNRRWLAVVPKGKRALEEPVGSFAFKAIIPQHFIVTPCDHGRYARNTTNTPHCEFAGLTRLCLEVDTIFRALGDGEGAKKRSADGSFVQVDDKGLAGAGVTSNFSGSATVPEQLRVILSAALAMPGNRTRRAVRLRNRSRGSHG